MAIRNTKLGGTDFTEEGLKPSDFNDTNDAIIDNAEEDDGFIIVDSDILQIVNDADNETDKRSYTLNKDVDGLLFSTELTNISSGRGDMRFYKNNVQIVSTNIFVISGGFNDGSDSGRLLYDHSANSISSELNQLQEGVSIQIYINESFNATDVLKLTMETNSSNTFTSKNRVLQGVKNKTTDTTWVSIA